MRLFSEAGCHSMTVSELAAALRSGRDLHPRTVLITFDDGLQDFATGAMPVLQRYGLSATLYVVSGCVGGQSHWLAPLGEGNRPMLTWEELSNVRAAGIEIGAHTMSHPQLDILNPAQAQKEISLSKSVLENGLGALILSFAYPHGYASATTRMLVRKAGFTSACRVRHALSSQDEDCYALSRIIMTRDMDDDYILKLLGGSGLPVAPPIDRLAADGWRLVRRIQHLRGAAT
ncbi:MAG: polysaccharide deacetylase family protein [Rhizobiaceae bacterium]